VKWQGFDQSLNVFSNGAWCIRHSLFHMALAQLLRRLDVPGLPGLQLLVVALLEAGSGRVFRPCAGARLWVEFQGGLLWRLY